jgi:hypothetical protein
MKTKKFNGTLVGARIRLHDGTVGTVLNMPSSLPDRYLIGYKGSGGTMREVGPSEIAECGNDVEFRCKRYCNRHGIKFVSMKSLSTN